MNQRVDVWSNPSENVFFIASQSEIRKVNVLSVTGQSVPYLLKLVDGISQLEILGKPGTYFLLIETDSGYAFQRRIVKM